MVLEYHVLGFLRILARKTRTPPQWSPLPPFLGTSRPTTPFQKVPLPTVRFPHPSFVPFSFRGQQETAGASPLPPRPVAPQPGNRDLKSSLPPNSTCPVKRQKSFPRSPRAGSRHPPVTNSSFLPENESPASFSEERNSVPFARTELSCVFQNETQFRFFKTPPAAPAGRVCPGTKKVSNSSLFSCQAFGFY